MLQKSATLAQIKRHDHLKEAVKFMPNNTEECYNVTGINTALPIVYDSTCPGLCCFENTPCRYCTAGCGGACPTNVTA